MFCLFVAELVVLSTECVRICVLGVEKGKQKTVVVVRRRAGVQALWPGKYGENANAIDFAVECGCNQQVRLRASMRIWGFRNANGIDHLERYFTEYPSFELCLFGFMNKFNILLLKKSNGS